MVSPRREKKEAKIKLLPPKLPMNPACSYNKYIHLRLKLSLDSTWGYLLSSLSDLKRTEPVSYCSSAVILLMILNDQSESLITQ